MGVARLLTPDAINTADLIEACVGDAIRMKPLIQWLVELNGVRVHGR